MNIAFYVFERNQDNIKLHNRRLLTTGSQKWPTAPMVFVVFKTVIEQPEKLRHWDDTKCMQEDVIF